MSPRTIWLHGYLGAAISAIVLFSLDLPVWANVLILAVVMGVSLRPLNQSATREEV